MRATYSAFPIRRITSLTTLATLTALTALLQACGGGPKSSSTSGNDGGPMPTSSMVLDLKVIAEDGNTAVVRANLNDGKVLGASYRLDGGDYFRACSSGECRNMADNDSVFTPDYIARLAYQPGVDYVVSFNRREDKSALDSRVVLPPAFTIVTPANNSQVSDGDTIQLTWSPNGAPARVYISFASDCTTAGGTHNYSGGVLVADSDPDGNEALRVNDILSISRTNPPVVLTRCSIDLILQHEMQGRVDPAFRRGTAFGIVSRKVSVDYIPR